MLDIASRLRWIVRDVVVRFLHPDVSWTAVVSLLADHLDVSRQSVNALETGRFDPSLPLAFRIARLRRLPMEQIFVDVAEVKLP